MPSFNTSINWESSNTYTKYYINLVKRYLTLNNETDHSKFTFSLVGNHHPVINRWDYPNVPKPCRYRFKRLEKNYFKFDLEDIVAISPALVNKTDPNQIEIKTSENAHFKKVENFKPPIVSYFLHLHTNRCNENGDEENSGCNLDSTLIGASIRVNPWYIRKVDNKWMFSYDIKSSVVGMFKIVFQMKYVYYVKSTTRINRNDFDDDEDDSVDVEEEVIEETIIPIQSEKSQSTNFKRNTPISSSLKNPKEMHKIYPSLDLQTDIKSLKGSLTHLTINPSLSTSTTSSRLKNKKNQLVKIHESSLQKLNTLNGRDKSK
jgi:hypothetical protein